MTTDSTNTVLANKLGPLIDTLAAKLSVPARGVWDIMLAQARVEFVKASIAVAIEFVVLGLVVWLAVLGTRRLRAGDEDAGFTMLLAAGLVGTFTLIMLAMSVDGWITALGHTMNPGYFAITKLLAAVK